MDSNVVECELGENECVCKSGATLDILRDVQRAYEDRLELVERVGGAEKMQMQVRVLRSWVSDLVAQNALLVRAVEDLERETTARVEAERRRHKEVECELRAEAAVLRRRLARKDSDLRGLVEVLRRLREFDHCTLDGIHFFEVTQSDIYGSDHWLTRKMGDGNGDSRGEPAAARARRGCPHAQLRLFPVLHTWVTTNYLHKSVSRTWVTIAEQRSGGGGMERDHRMLELSLANDSLQKDVVAKDREIRRLNKDLQQYEQTMARMRDERNPDVLLKDAEVMAGMCCTGTECGDLVPVKDFGEMLREETRQYRERIQNMEISLKSSSVKLRAAHKINLGLAEELNALRRVCVAIDVERRDTRLKLELEEQIIKQMVRHLRQAKAKLQQKGLEHPSNTDFVSGDHFGPPTSHSSMPASAGAGAGAGAGASAGAGAGAGADAACVRQPRARARTHRGGDASPPDRNLDSSGDFRPHEDGSLLSRKSN